MKLAADESPGVERRFALWIPGLTAICLLSAIGLFALVATEGRARRVAFAPVVIGGVLFGLALVAFRRWIV